MQEAKALAVEEGTTFTALIEDSLRERIARSKDQSHRRERIELPVSRQGGGLHPRLDPEIISDNSKLADRLDEFNGDPGR
jgi:hypothetical protein